jgi:hypothetical protein
MKMAVFWVVTPCSLVEVYRRFGGACCLHHQGGRGKLLPDYTALQPRRQPSSSEKRCSLLESCVVLQNVTEFWIMESREVFGVWAVRKNQWIVTATNTVMFTLQEIIRVMWIPFVPLCLQSGGTPTVCSLLMTHQCRQ